MAKGITIKLEGLDKVLKNLKEEGDDIKKMVDFAMAANTEAMATEAKNRAPVDTGRLRASITSNKIRNYSYELVAQTKYAPYLEFGTGKYAATYVGGLEKEWQILAKQFYVNGQGRIPAQPYFYPSVKRITPILFKDVENILDRNVRL